MSIWPSPRTAVTHDGTAHKTYHTDMGTCSECYKFQTTSWNMVKQFLLDQKLREVAEPDG